MRSANKNTYETLLQEHGYRITPKRIALLTFLANSKTPLTRVDIQKKLNYKLDKVTLYRALEDFCSSKILAKVNLQGPAAYYEFLHQTHHHHHIKCETCGKIEHMEICNQVSIEKEVLKHSKSFNTINSHSLEFFGICKTCSK